MRSKEQDSVYFHSLASWHFIPLEAAKRFSRIDFNNFDYQKINDIWFAGTGRGLCMETVYRIFEDKGIKKITREIVEKLPPGSWISSDGRTIFKK